MYFTAAHVQLHRIFSNQEKYQELVEPAMLSYNVKCMCTVHKKGHSHWCVLRIKDFTPHESSVSAHETGDISFRCLITVIMLVITSHQCGPTKRCQIVSEMQLYNQVATWQLSASLLHPAKEKEIFTQLWLCSHTRPNGAGCNNSESISEWSRTFSLRQLALAPLSSSAHQSLKWQSNKE